MRSDDCSSAERYTCAPFQDLQCKYIRLPDFTTVAHISQFVLDKLMLNRWEPSFFMMLRMRFCGFTLCCYQYVDCGGKSSEMFELCCV